MKNVLPFLFCCIVLTGLCPGKLFAQRTDTTQKRYSFALTEANSYTGLNLTSLNEALNAHGIPTARDRFLMASYAFTAFPRPAGEKFFFDLGFGIVRSGNTTDTFTTRLSLYQPGLNIYYTLWHTRRSMFYPGLGAGMLFYVLALTNKFQTPASFNDALSGFQGERRLITNNTFLNFSLNYNWAVDKDRDFFITADAGYRLGLSRPHWRLDNGVPLDGSSTVSAGGLYAGIGILLP